MYQLNVFVPDTHLEEVKDALFNAGAGKLGDYERCSWQTLGMGQFKPTNKAQPFIGEVGKVEKVSEYFLTVICNCKKSRMKNIIKELINVHPYETPSYQVIELTKTL